MEAVSPDGRGSVAASPSEPILHRPATEITRANEKSELGAA